MFQRSISLKIQASESDVSKIDLSEIQASEIDKSCLTGNAGYGRWGSHLSDNTGLGNAGYDRWGSHLSDYTCYWVYGGPL